jgi:hypothetical protein
MHKEEYFAYLDELRESGQINMFGAVPYLQDVFGMNRYDARKILLEWMNTFSQRHAEKNTNTSV